jgi:hypothetical protein
MTVRVINHLGRAELYAEVLLTPEGSFAALGPEEQLRHVEFIKERKVRLLHTHFVFHERRG